MKTWLMIIDVEKCEDCNNCFMACKDEFVDNEWPGYSVAQPRHGHRWINIMRKERGQYPLIDVAYLPMPCQHCDDAPCVKAGGGAVYKRRDGIVLIDPVKAGGQKNIVNSCPYRMIWWNEEKDVAQKCTFCAHLLDQGWKEPRCVQVCPTGALRVAYVEEDQMTRLVEDEGLECLDARRNTQPRVYYKNMYRYSRCFIAGSVAVEKDGIEDCAKGAKVSLFRGGQKIGEVLADNYGDFKFDRLEEYSGTYTLDISYADFAPRELTVDLGASVSVGTVCFGRDSAADPPA